MVDFTHDELLEICNMAMDRADKCYKSNYKIGYDIAKSIFIKANDEYSKSEER